MHKSRRELLDDFVAFMGETGDDNARNTAERALNRSLTALWLKHPWRQFRSPVPFQLTLAINQARYALPDYFGRVGPGEVRNLTQGGKIVHALPDGGSDRGYPESGTTSETAGSPLRYETAGVCGVYTQPAVTGDALEVVSDNAADTDIVVAIDGDDSSGRWTRRQVTLSGTVPVAIGTWVFVDEFAKAYQASVTPVTELTSSRGTVTLRKTSDATALQTLFAQESAKEHTVFAVVPKPVAADVLAIPILRRPKRLFHDADPVPDLWEPAIWEEMTIAWKVNTGDMSVGESLNLPRPAFLDLLAFDNASKGRARTRPYQRP